MVSEFMLQQTPVSRVLPKHTEWLARWPTPGDLAAESAGEAVRAWGRLGYPRRALRLHRAATMIRDHFDGQVPSAYDDLRALPGVGDYTASAIAAFAYGQRIAVLDTNVRRVHWRLFRGLQYPPDVVYSHEREDAWRLLPADPGIAATWSVAVMELGALVCTARSPSCDSCPVAQWCVWRGDGYPAYDGPPRRGQTYAGTDRQCRGRLLAVLREAPGSVAKPLLDVAWPAARSGPARVRRRGSSRSGRPRSRAGWCAAAAAHPAPGRSHAWPAASLAAWVSSMPMSLSRSRCRAWRSSGRRSGRSPPGVSWWNTMMSSMRLRNSGRKCCFSSSLTLAFIRSYDVRCRPVRAKPRRRPWRCRGCRGWWS
jgi:A/G-specific adenine glycosylase